MFKFRTRVCVQCASLTVVTIVGVVWAAFLIVNRSNASISPLQYKSDADLRAVRVWLQNNTDGQWEELEWWPARKITNRRFQYCRLKYRTRDDTIEDVIFCITHEGTATPSFWTWCMHDQRGWKMDDCWDELTDPKR